MSLEGIVKRLVIGLVFCSSLLAQTNLPKATSAFEVASVKPSASASDRALVQAVPGRLLIENFARSWFLLTVLPIIKLLAAHPG